MLEKRIERRLVDRVREAGGLAMKWTSPSMSGVPDRLCLLPGGRVVFVELKAPGQRPTPLQLRMHQMLSALGADVRVLDSIDAVDAWIREMTR